jgi:hypothetical protein
MVFFLAESIFKLSQIMSVNMLLLAAAAGLRIPTVHQFAGTSRVNPSTHRRTEWARNRPAEPKDRNVTDPDLQL